MKYVAVILCVLMCGCSTRKVEEATEKTTGTERMVLQIPAIVVDTPVGQVAIQPVQVTTVVDKSEHKQSNTQGSTNTTPNIPPQAYAAAGSGLAAAIPGLGGIGAIAFAAWRMLQDKNRQIEYHKKDAEEGWQKADARALALPPEKQA